KDNLYLSLNRKCAMSLSIHIHLESRPVEQLVQYQLSTSKTILPKQYAVRQMIAHEIETEIIRRREEASHSRNKDVKKPELTKSKSNERIKPKDTSKQISLDFFGRACTPKAKATTTSAKMEGNATLF
ncbi:hypothetical protein CU098_000972, partial [Rhizopus stolonifer]